MAIKNSLDEYGLIAKTFHWGIFALFVTLFVLAEIMMDMPKGPERGELYQLHKSFGVLVLLLVICRVLWKANNIKPMPLSSLSPWQQKMADLVHLFLYSIMLLMPISGIMMSQGGGHPIVVFNLFELPSLFPKNEPIGDTGHLIHEILSYVIYGVVGLHALAALKHHFINKDDTLRRMLKLKQSSDNK